MSRVSCVPGMLAPASRLLKSPPMPNQAGTSVGAATGGVGVRRPAGGTLTETSFTAGIVAVSAG
mgnify:CR=1 FL=1